MPTLKATRIIPLPTLRVTSGTTAGATVRLTTSRLRIGRSLDNDLVLSDPAVSRHHAVIDQVRTMTTITDLGSTAGTTVNGRPVRGRAVVRHGDVLTIGPVEIHHEDPVSPGVRDEPTADPIARETVLRRPQVSPRQLDVLTLLCRGATDDGITHRTVRSYTQELHDRLGTTSRAATVAAAAQLGLV